MSDAAQLSIIIPVYYSAATLEGVVKSVVEVIGGRFFLKEIICVDDGSQDESWEKIKQLSQIYPQVRGLRLSRNFGQWPATMCGLQNGTGDIFLTLDDDGQCDPRDGIRIIEKLIQGNHDVVVGMRNQIRTQVLTFFSLLLWGKAHTSNFVGLKKEVIHSLGRNTFTKMSLDAHLRWVMSPDRIKKIEVPFIKRARGKTQYTFLRRVWMVLKNIPHYFGTGQILIGSLSISVGIRIGLGEYKSTEILFTVIGLGILTYLHHLFLSDKGKPYYWIIERCTYRDFKEN